MNTTNEHLACQPKNTQKENIQSKSNVTGTEEMIPKNQRESAQQKSNQNAEVAEAGGSKNISILIDSCKIGNIEHHITGDKNNIQLSYTANGAPLNVFNNSYVTFEPNPRKRNPINNTELAVDTFIGRVTEMNDIMQRFHQYPVVAIAAMGGMGKTQLARKFSSENADVYRDRYWINAETEEQLLKSFDRLARKVKVDANTDLDTVRDTYKSFNEGAALLIFDNVEHVNNVYKYLPTRIQLEDITLHVLVTSRWTEWTSDSSVNCYQLQPLDISVSLQLFQRKFGGTCIETMQGEWEKLATILGCLPLALQVAASYISKRTKHNSDLHTILSDYIQQLVEGARKLLNDSLTEYDNQSVYASMLLSLKQLESNTDDEWKLAVTLINVAAYMNPDRIFKEPLLKLLDKDDNICILDDALAILTEFSLLNQVIYRRGNKCYTVHRIIQTSIRQNQTVKATADMYYSEALKCVLAGNYYFPRDMLQYAHARASAVVYHYEANPSSTLLIDLIQYNFITAVQTVFKLMNRNQIQSLLKQQDLLYSAVLSENLGIIELLCYHGADINQLSHEEAEPPLYCALKWGNMDIVKWLLQNGATPSVRDRAGRTALHLASIRAMHETVSDIIKTDSAAVHVTDNLGNTPLLTIGYSNNEEDILSTIRILVKSGADMTKINNKGNTVLHSTARYARAAAVSLILQLNKLLINIVNQEGQTALHVLGSGFIDRIKYLTKEGRKNAFEGFKETARVLSTNGLSLDTKDKEERTPLDTVLPEFKDILRQVADECNNQLMTTSETTNN